MRSLAVWLSAAIVIAVLGFIGGRALANEPEQTFAFEPRAPGYEAIESVAGLSKGGFSGFGEIDGFEGATVMAGRIVSVSPAGVTLESSAGVESIIRLTGERPLRMLDASGREALRPGVTIVVRVEPDSETATSVLVLP